MDTSTADAVDDIAAAEIKSLKPGARVYERRTPNIFFLSSPEKALDAISERRKNKDAGKKQ